MASTTLSTLRSPVLISSSRPSRQRNRSVPSVDHKSTIILENPNFFHNDHSLSSKENGRPVERELLDARGLKPPMRRLRVSPSKRAFHPDSSLTPPTTPVSAVPQSVSVSPRLSVFTTFSDSRPFWLMLYFFFNLGLTLYNKYVLVRFPFPYTLTALHALCGSIGGYLLEEKGIFVRKKLGVRDTVVLTAFSVLYAVNIVVSNVSLQMVTVPFHQVVRAATPIFTIALSTLLLRQQSSRAKLISLLPVVAGVALATYGDYYFTLGGFVLTVLGTFLAALKTIFTHLLQSPTLPQSSPPLPSSSSSSSLSSSPPSQPKTPSMAVSSSLHLNPLDLLTRMSPLAFIQCVIYAHITGELDRVRQYSAHNMTLFLAAALAMNGTIAFGLNVVSFIANGRVGAVGICVAANVKQVLTILCAVAIFDLTITNTNAIGIGLTLLGGAWYAIVEYQEKMMK